MKMSVEEETKLALAAQRGDLKARELLFRRHIPLVKWLAFKYSGPDNDELFSAACEGWMHALRTWKHGKGSGFKAWLTWWVRAYVARLTQRHLERRSIETSFELPGSEGNGEPLYADIDDEGIAAEDMADGLWRRQALGIVDGMKDRRLAVVLQQRMRGRTYKAIAADPNNQALLRIKVKTNGHEWVRQLEKRAVIKAKAIARASA